MTTNAHGRHATRPHSITRRRPTRSEIHAEQATHAMLVSPPSAPMPQMKLREYPRWLWAYITRNVLPR